MSSSSWIRFNCCFLFSGVGFALYASAISPYFVSWRIAAASILFIGIDDLLGFPVCLSKRLVKLVPGPAKL